MPDVQRLTIRDVVLASAERYGSAPLLRDSRMKHDFTEVLRIVNAVGGFVRDYAQGARVVVFSGSRVEAVEAWWAASSAGSEVALLGERTPRGRLTELLQELRPRIVFVEDTLVDCLTEALRSLHDVPAAQVVLAGPGSYGSMSRTDNGMYWAEAAGRRGTVLPEVDPESIATILYTSGTTSSAKGVLRSHRFEIVSAERIGEALRLGPGCRFWSCLPLAHMTTANCVALASLVCGSEAILGPRFSASRFWSEAKAAQASHSVLPPEMGALLMKQAPSGLDRSHELKYLWTNPRPWSVAEFEARFNIELVWQGYGSTEIFPFTPWLGRQARDRRQNCIGKPDPDMEAVVVDDHGVVIEGGRSEIGNLLVRPAIPGRMMSGYLGSSDVTVEKWRDLWFHTGDLASQDADGFFYLQGRSGDVVRRMGENIVLGDIVRLVDQLESVREAAVYSINMETGQQEIKLDLVLSDGAGMEDVVSYLERELPSFAVPRFVEVVDSLPKTETGRVAKRILAEAGVHRDAVWDRRSGK